MESAPVSEWKRCASHCSSGKKFCETPSVSQHFLHRDLLIIIHRFAWDRPPAQFVIVMRVDAESKFRRNLVITGDDLFFVVIEIKIECILRICVNKNQVC